jgi:hypothetical protein
MYYDSFFLNAANTSRILRANATGKAKGQPSYTYTVHPWVVQLFFDCDESHVRGFPHVPNASALRCPTPAQRTEFAKALTRKDAVMQAFQHSSEPEVFDAGTFDAGLMAAQKLAAMFNVPPPKVLSQRDVPGLTRAVVPLLAKRGILGVSVGSNDGSPAPMVPSTFDCYHGHQQVRTLYVRRAYDRFSQNTNHELSPLTIICRWHPYTT